jgi:predicted kinase
MEVIVTIGISGSGKSTWSKEFIRNNKNTIIICPDDIRIELTGDINNQSLNYRVFKLAYSRLEEYIKENKYDYIIFDSTCCNFKTLNEILSTSNVSRNEDSELKIRIKLFKADPEISKSRIKLDIESGVNRSRVPDEIIDKQYNNYLNVKKSVYKLSILNLIIEDDNIIKE